MYVTLQSYPSKVVFMYLVKAPLLAVCRDRAGKAFITVPPESVISVEGPVNTTGLIEIRYQDDTLLAFMSDIEERTELLPCPLRTAS